MKKLKKILWISVAVLVVFVIARLSMPSIVEYVIVGWFEQQGVQAKVEEIRFDLSDGNFSIRGVTANKKNTRVLKLDTVAADWSWSGLFNSEARVNSIKLGGLAFDVVNAEGNNLIIAGIDINKLLQSQSEAETSTDDTEQEPLEWQVFLDNLLLTNFDICYRQLDLDYCNRFDRLSWQGDLRVDLSKLDNPAMPIFAKGSFGIDTLQIHDNALDRDLANFQQFSIDGINIATLESVGFGDLTLSSFNFCFKQPDHDHCGHFDKLGWQGILNANLSSLDGTPPPLNAQGSFEIEALKVHDNILDRDLTSFQRFSIKGIDIATLESVGIGDLTLSNFDFCFKQPDQDHCGHFDKLGWQGILNANLSSLDGTPPPLNAQGSFEIEALKVHDNILDRDLTSFQQFSIKGIDIATLESVGFGDLTLSSFNFCFKQPDQDHCGHFDKLGWQGILNANLSSLDGTPPPLNAQGSFEIEALKVHDNILDRNLASFNQLLVEGIDIASLDSIAFKSLSLTPLSLLTRREDKLPQQVTRIESLNLDNVALNTFQQLSIDQITVRDHELLLINKADKTLELLEWLPAQSVPEKPVSSSPTGQSADFQYAINKFVYESDKSIQYRDNSLEKPFIVDLNNMDILVENLDSNKPEQDSNIAYSAQYADHGKITLQGTARPLSEKPSFNLAGTISGLDLRDISPFTTDAIGHSIKSGQLDAELELTAEKSQLNSKVDLKLHHFQLTAKSPEAEEKINADFGYPLNSSLSLLKDSDNTIVLSIPVTGDLENPDFDANDVVRKATSSAITSAIISYYTPFGLVMVVEGLIDLASALDFEATTFAAGVHNLEPGSKEDLDKLTQLLRERPGIHLTLCSFTNSADRKILLPETVEIAADQLQLEAEQLGKLTELGEARSKAVKQYLVDKKVDASRLVLCTAEHEEGEGLAGVEISI